MARTLSALALGALFGVGLTVSQMVNPAKVLGFLDVSGHWDPSLAFVMGGALLVTTPAFAWARRRERPLLADRFLLPTRRDLDGRLLGGAALFGVGWGLSGFCPGPALASLGLGVSSTLPFVASMIAASALTRWIDPRFRPEPTHSPGVAPQRQGA